jgi:D-3-phosphoglycerate dehydrogenase / 2-oxoglutarate reductase
MPDRRVLVTDYTWADTRIEAAVLGQIDAELVHADTGQESELVELVGGCDAILTCFAQVTPTVIRAGPRLRVIARYGIGTDNIAVDTASQLGIPVTNVPGFCADEVAEHAIALIFALVRGLTRYDSAVRQGDWSLATGLPTTRLAGSTIGIVGNGATARALRERANGLGMRALVHHRTGGVPLERLLADADYVSLHVPATAETAGMVDDAFLAAMKPTAYLINCARGALVDEAALARAVETGVIAGAGLDVLSSEPPPPDHPLLTCDRVVLTPHTAFYSEQSVAELAKRAALSIVDIFSGRQPESVVNLRELV